jgi:hypothetical protein
VNRANGSILYWICISTNPTHPLADNYNYAKINEIKKLTTKSRQDSWNKKNLSWGQKGNFESGQRSRGSKGQGNITTVNKYPKIKHI